MPAIIYGHIAFRRLLAFAADWLIIALWGGLLFGFSLLATGGELVRPGEPWAAQGLGFLTMTLPVTLYFAFCESSRWRASLGKRVAGLVVFRESGARLSFGRAFFRNAIKFVPWEFGHTVAQHAASAGSEEFPVWLWGPAAAAAVGPLWWFAAMCATGRAPYDRWTDARVMRLQERE